MLLAFGATACFDWDSYDPRLVSTATGGGDGAGGQGLEGGGGIGGSGGSGPECTGTEFECLPDGTAQVCDGGTWQSLGACPLGCDEGAGQCMVPSNVDAESVGAGNGDVVLQPGGSGVVYDTDTGEISEDGQIIRPAGEGLDSASGIAFAVHDQGGDAPGLGVFSMGSLTVPDGATLIGQGANALVLAVDGDVQIDGIVSVTATDEVGGPGGSAGGAVGTAGSGDCGGQPGTGSYPGDNCTSGGGGAGYSATGGPGGDSVCAAPDDHTGGPGGAATCGTPALVPLLGGSGGAGGTEAVGGPDSTPGPGGGGGGALQITAAGAIVISATGGINAGGAGGAGSDQAGGAGGGAGGAVLLEAPVVSVAVGAVLAANGGGGGGGDCN